MKYKHVTSYTISIVALIAICGCNYQKNNDSSDGQFNKPNIIYILADDLGYNQIGAYGQTKIETPNLDQLAKEGMVFTEHYASAPVCAPARYMLLTGVNAGHAYIRGNDEWKSRGDVWNYEAMEKDPNLEGQRPMPDDTQTIAKKLKEVNYRTAIFGKWGLGSPNSNSIPTKMGFDYFYGYNGQRQAHNYYPLHLYENDKRVPLNNDTIYPHQFWDESLNVNDSVNYVKYTQVDYSPDLIFKKLQTYIDLNSESPFFIYWATPIPHAAIQAPAKWLSHYKIKFGPEESYTGKGYFPQQNPRAGYAAMVSYLDENIGKLIKQLKAKGLYENTLIIFTSDNGPAHEGGTDTAYFNDTNPFPNTGTRGKGSLYEGGIKVPMIASWPNVIEASSVSSHASVQYDIMATLGDITGYNVPDNTDGISFYSEFKSDPSQKNHDFIYWEFPERDGQVAIRMKEWKLIVTNLKEGKPFVYELYNLKNDPKESMNVADQNPEIVKKALHIIKKEHSKPEIEKFNLPIDSL